MSIPNTMLLQMGVAAFQKGVYGIAENGTIYLLTEPTIVDGHLTFKLVEKGKKEDETIS